MVQYFTSHKSWDLIFSFRMILWLLLWVSQWLLLEYIRFPMDWLFTYCIHTWSFIAIAEWQRWLQRRWVRQRRQQQWMWNTLTNWTFIRFIDFLTTQISLEMESSAFRNTLHRRLQRNGKNQRNVIQCHKITYTNITS